MLQMNAYQQAKDINNYFLNILAPAFGITKTQYRKRPIVCVGVDPDAHNMLQLYMMINSKSHIEFSFQAKPDWNVDDYVVPLFSELLSFGTSSIMQWRTGATSQQSLHDNVLGTAAIVFTVLQAMLNHSQLSSRERVQVLAATGILSGLIDDSGEFLYDNLLPVEHAVRDTAEDVALVLGNADGSVVETDPGMNYDIEQGKGEMIRFLADLVYDQVFVRVLFNQILSVVIYGLRVNREHDAYIKYLANDNDPNLENADVATARDAIIDFLMYLSPQFMKVICYNIDPKYSKKHFIKISW